MSQLSCLIGKVLLIRVYLVAMLDNTAIVIYVPSTNQRSWAERPVRACPPKTLNSSGVGILITRWARYMMETGMYNLGPNI